MSETRFPTLAPGAMSAAQQEIARTLTAGPRGGVRGPYVPLIYSPELAERMRHLGDFIRFEGVLPPRLKEIVIFTVARHWNVDFMFAVHRQTCAAAGVAADIPDAIEDGRRPAGLDAVESAAVDAAQALLRTGGIGDALFATLRGHLGERGVIELVAFVGYYCTLAMILNTGRIPVPEGARPLKPR